MYHFRTTYIRSKVFAPRRIAHLVVFGLRTEIFLDLTSSSSLFFPSLGSYRLLYCCRVIESTYYWSIDTYATALRPIDHLVYAPESNHLTSRHDAKSPRKTDRRCPPHSRSGYPEKHQCSSQETPKTGCTKTQVTRETSAPRVDRGGVRECHG